MMGEEGSRIMLSEGAKVDAKEALRIGLISEIVVSSGSEIEIALRDSNKAFSIEEIADTALVRRAIDVAQRWVSESRPRISAQEEGLVEKLQQVNRVESKQLAESFFQPPFLQAQYEFAKSKNKTGPTWVFWLLNKMQPLLAKL